MKKYIKPDIIVIQTECNHLLRYSGAEATQGSSTSQIPLDNNTSNDVPDDGETLGAKKYNPWDDGD
jgi:hypothetical protein